MYQSKQTSLTSVVHARNIAAAVVLALVGFSVQAADWPPVPPLEMPTETDPGPTPESVAVQPLYPGVWRCTFRMNPTGAVETLALAGTFNEWDASVWPLHGPDEAGDWVATYDLPTGTHLYKFVVNGDQWLPDPMNTDTVHDNHGGQNAVLRLGAVAHMKTSAAKLQDGEIDVRAVRHVPSQPLYFQRVSAREALVRLRTLSHDVERVWVVAKGGGKAALQRVDEDELFTLWEGQITFPVEPSEPAARRRPAQYRYTFLLQDGALQGSGPVAYYGVPVTQEDSFRTPDWAKHAIWYQIFPDRFRNGDPRNDRDPVRPWTSDWFTPSPWEGQDGQTFYKFYVFDRQYGGDIKGLEEKLGYLKELGVTALYFNPVFKAESNHKYNAETYLHIDDHFGVKGDYDKVKDQENHNDPSTWQWTESDKMFLAFIKKAKAMGFKVIIDGVFNHVGTAHPAFQDVKKNKQNSKYAGWFNVTSWDPFEYEGWFGHDQLPVFKKSKNGFASKQVRDYVYNVTRRWMDPDGDGDPSDGIDGWRLDVPNEVPAGFWVGWRKLVKEINPDAYITGEIWERADEWLTGDHYDAVMNYEFSRAVVSYVFHKKWQISASELDRRLRELRFAYPNEATYVLQNLMDSHDTDRMASMALNPDRGYDGGNRVQDNGPQYNNNKPGAEEYQRCRLAALIQMTYVGAPMIYYGDEVGMWGADDPTCRKPMLWKDLEPYDKPEENFVMEDHLAYYKRVIALRNAHPALRTGAFHTLLADDEQNVWAFLRKDDKEQLIVAVNPMKTAAKVQVPLPQGSPAAWKAVFGTQGNVDVQDGKVALDVPPISGVVYHAAAPQ
jgi:cyclomaltodextrinase